jgi:hypothetical protein
LGERRPGHLTHANTHMGIAGGGATFSLARLVCATLALTDFASRLNPPAWAGDALCREHPEIVWVAQTPSKRAKAVCQDCLVREECLAYALDDPLLVGIWGGTDAHERRVLRGEHRRQPRYPLQQTRSRRAG